MRLRQAADAQPQALPEGSGRGIVICAGGARLFTCAWLLVAMLRRKLQCRLPIEVWHIGDAELGPSMRALLEGFDVRVVDALKISLRHPVEILGGWQLKTYALMHSAFREILLLDADNMPVIDPTFLFASKEFIETGALFWPDIVRLKANNPIWEISGLSSDDGASFETGQVLIDKHRQWRALVLAHWINQNHAAFDDLLYGDKDACYVAWRMLGFPYDLVRHRPKLLDHTFVQRSPSGELLFQHRNGAKWLLNGPNPHIEGFRMETECLMMLAELRTLWDGTIFNPPSRSAAAQALERHLVTVGRFRLIWVGSHEKTVTLRLHHLVEGGSEDERYWFVADGVEGAELRFVARGLLSCSLRSDADRIWRGNAGQFFVELHPEVPDFALGLDPNATGLSDALLAVADRLLDGGDRPSYNSNDIVIALATLAGLDAALPAHLEGRAGETSNGSDLARAALARFRSTSPVSGPVRTGTGWQTRPGNISEQSEAVPKR